mmetsp:Transcript_107359/g.256454  ORF Transcript_107359/g.256454 Transcript_107359/m.256454 type:complete len:690 (-) Transcript_107359:106-2175(-)
MEILLQGTKGVSPDAVLSIRAGATRRQVSVSQVGDKPFKFPCTVRECGAIKVQVLSVEATARAVLTEGEQQTVTLQMGKTAKAEAAPAEDAEVALLVRSASGDQALSKESLAAKKQALAGSAEEYLARHGVQSFLHGLLLGVIKDRPEDPYSYVAQQFSAKAKEVEASVEDMRQTARDALLQGARSGKLLEVLRDGGSPKNRKGQDSPSSEGVESLRKQAAALLWQSAQSGKLFEVLEEAKGSPLEEPPQAPPEKQAAPEPPEAPAELGQQLAALEEPPRAPQEVDPVAPAEGAPELKAEHSDLRLAAREALMQGVQSGKLEQVLATKLQKGSAPSALNELEALREQARQALLEGAQSGQLLEILKDKERKDKSKEVDETEALRQEARAALLEGVQSGRLVELLSKKEPEKEPEDVELLRQQARVALLEGAQSGKLFEVLNQKDTDPDDLEVIRRQARDALLMCAQSGKLAEVLGQRGAQVDELEALRKQAREALMQGAQSGKLQDVLTEKLELKSASKSNSKSEGGEAPADEEEANQLRQEALTALLAGVESGKLKEALAASRNDTEEIELLRQQAREALLAGAQSGKLQQALGDDSEDVDMLRQKAREALLAGAQSGKLFEVLQQPSEMEVTQKPEVPLDRSKVLETHIELQVMQDEKRQLTTEKTCLEQLVTNLESKNEKLKQKSA